MYQAKLHPEQYSNTFNDEQIKRLHDAIMYVCDTAIEANGDSDGFPKEWLMKHRWSKGKKDASKLPTGEKITFLKVGGRTSAIVPSVQKKTAAVAGDVAEEGGEEEDAEEDTKPKKGSKRKAKAVEEDEQAEEKPSARPKRGRKNAKEEVKEESEDTTEEKTPPKPKRGRKAAKEDVEEKAQPVKKEAAVKGTVTKGKATVKEDKGEEAGKRRSGRLSK
jgi:formamidopyrimidine-DNA glycosylase